MKYPRFIVLLGIAGVSGCFGFFAFSVFAKTLGVSDQVGFIIAVAVAAILLILRFPPRR